jgi:hypothetical protein
VTASRLYPRISGFKGIKLKLTPTKTSNSGEIIKDTLKGGIGYLHSFSKLKCTCVLMFMIWCSHNAHGTVQGECGDARPSTFSELIKNALYRQMTVEGLAQRQINKVSDERNQDRI